MIINIGITLEVDDFSLTQELGDNLLTQSLITQLKRLTFKKMREDIIKSYEDHPDAKVIHCDVSEAMTLDHMYDELKGGKT